jgi:NTP pyrophosphatase (non-canonical NTP hydrolase)
MIRPEASDKALLAAVEALTVNLGRRIEEKGRGVFVSSHETLGAVTEEYQELIDAVRQNDPVEVGEELMDIAVAAVFGVASMLQKEEELVNEAEPKPAD